MDPRFYREVLLWGSTANAVKLGTDLQLGGFWNRIDGCGVLYRGENMEQVDYENILAVIENDDALVSVPEYVEHSDSTTYYYVMHKVNGFGLEEHTLRASVRIDIDDEGEIAGPWPNSVCGLRVCQISDCKAELLWFHSPIAQRTKPVKFNIYYDAGGGQIDFENPIASIDYIGRKFYRYKSQALVAGTYWFCIKVEDENGIEDKSKLPIQIQISDSDPVDLEILCVDIV